MFVSTPPYGKEYDKEREILSKIKEKQTAAIPKLADARNGVIENHIVTIGTYVDIVSECIDAYDPEKKYDSRLNLDLLHLMKECLKGATRAMEQAMEEMKRKCP